MKGTILSRFQHEPSMVSEESHVWFESCISKTEGFCADLDAKGHLETVANDDFWFEADDYRSRFRPYNVKDGILQIPVKGVLLNGFPFQFGSFATGYEYILKAMQRGVDDDEVRGIALMIDSPGGMVAGNFDLADRMYEMRGKKPTKAFAAEYAFSAAYSIASTADEIIVTRSGGVGSVGVVTMHIDMSEALADRGIKVTFIHAGKHKVDGNPYQPLPENVRDRIQERINTTYSEFVGIVARNRGIEEKAVRRTEAKTFDAQEALDVKFADRIGKPDEEITAFAATFTQEEDDTMAEKNQAQTFTESDVTDARAEGVTEGMKQGAEATLKRINDIMQSDAGKAHPKAALKLALNAKLTAVDTETVIEMLADMPEEKAETPAGECARDDAAAGAGVGNQVFQTAMDMSNPGQVSAGGDTQMTPEEMKLEENRNLIRQAGLPGFKSATVQ